VARQPVGHAGCTWRVKQLHKQVTGRQLRHAPRSACTGLACLSLPLQYAPTADFVHFLLKTADHPDPMLAVVWMSQVAKDCVDKHVYAAVRAHGDDCFGQCPQPRNSTSPCFVTCFYHTMLGSKAGAGLGPEFITGGMDVRDLDRAWMAAFLSSDPLEGCPDLLQEERCACSAEHRCELSKTSTKTAAECEATCK
jgi:hypothetical protein